MLTHTPTGISSKVQDQHSQEQNRKIARLRMRELLDEHFNGENSVKQQRLRKFMLKKQSQHEKSMLSLERRQRFKEELAELNGEKAVVDEIDFTKLEDSKVKT